MMTDADLGGVEKVTVSSLRPELGLAPEHSLVLSDLDGCEIEDVGLADLHSFSFVKGYTRMMCCYTVLLCCQLQPGFLEAWEGQEALQKAFKEL